MRVTELCKSYFSGFQEISNYRNNTNAINALAMAKILSYFTVVIPAIFAVVYVAASLCGRVKEDDLSSHHKNNNTQVKKIQAPTIFDVYLKIRAREYAEKFGFGNGGFETGTGVLKYIIDVLDDPAYKQNSEEYMKKWTEDRRYTEEFRCFEDSAKEFFDEKLEAIEKDFTKLTTTEKLKVIKEDFEELSTAEKLKFYNKHFEVSQGNYLPLTLLLLGKIGWLQADKVISAEKSTKLHTDLKKNESKQNAKLPKPIVFKIFEYLVVN